MVSLSKLQKLGMTHKIVNSDDPRVMCTASGEESPIRGTVTLSYSLGGFFERRKFTVVNKCTHDFVLGMPFFLEHGPSVDYNNRTMTVGLFNQKECQPEYYTIPAVDTDVVPGSDTAIKFMRLGEARRLCRKNMAAVLLVHVRPALRAGRDLTDDEEGKDGPKSSTARGLQQRADTLVDGPARVHLASLAASPAESARQPMAAAASSGSAMESGHPSPIRSSDTTSDEGWARQVESLVSEYPTVFRAPDGVINRPGYEHKIELVENSTPPKKNAYRMTPRMLAELRKQLTDLLERGHIRPSNSPYGAPVIFVAKKDTDELRMCIDYRALNNITVKDAYPIPRIDQLVDILHGSACWSKMDMASAYNQFPVHKDSIALTGFVTRYGTFECTVMPFGLCNAPATCMRYMQHVLRDMLDMSVVVYLDDVLVYSPSREQHLIDLRNVMDRLQAADLRLKRKKCFFGVDRVEYLGFIITKEGVSMDPAKVKSIVGWPAPKSVTDVRSFLGMVGYYRKFLMSFADISAPLVELTKKGVPWGWNDARHFAFQALKEMLVTAPTLLIPDTSPGQSFVIHTDASDFAVGAVLLQDQGQGLQPCGYYSKKMNSAERNYSVGDKEMLAMKLALNEYRIYVEGVPTVLCTDHRNNVDLLTRPADKITSRRVARWVEYMQQFGRNLKLAFIKGEENQADALSRRADYYDEGEEDEDASAENGEKKTTLQPPLLLLASPTNLREQLLDPEDRTQLMTAIRCNVIQVSPGLLEREIRQAYARDGSYSGMGQAARNFRTEHDLQFIRGFWYKGSRMAVPDDLSLRKRIFRLCHNAQSHIGENKLLAALVLRFWWPGMIRDARSYVKECAVCARAKTSTQKKFGRLHSIPIPAASFQGISMDLMHLPKTVEGDFDTLLVVVCRRSKYVIAVPTTVRATTATIIGLLEEHVFEEFGAPDSIICDNDIRFTSDEFARFASQYDIDVRFSTTYHPQTDGQTERANLTIANMLRTRLRNRAELWVEYLDSVVEDYNNSVHASTKLSPHFAVYKRHPKQPIDVEVPRAYPVATPLDVRNAETTLERNVAHAVQQQAKYYDKHRRDVSYAVNDKVYVDARFLPKRTTMTKMHHRREGPFRISRVVADGKAYVVSVPNGYDSMQYVTLSVDKLSPYQPSSRWGTDRGRTVVEDNPEPVLILGHSQRQHEQPRYLVRYRGHHAGLDEFVPARYLPKGLVHAYLRSNKKVVLDPV